jgi:hypothetical protein
MDDRVFKQTAKPGKPTANPYYVGFWEYVYEKETKLFDTLLTQKANYLKALKNKDLFAMPDDEARQTQRRITYLSSELNTLYGFKLFTDQMRNCYLDSIDKIYAAYYDRNLDLEMEVYHQYYGYMQLLHDYLLSQDEISYWINYAFKNKQLKEDTDE